VAARVRAHANGAMRAGDFRGGNGVADTSYTDATRLLLIIGSLPITYCPAGKNLVLVGKGGVGWRQHASKQVD
jgi:hypothetical protein